MTTTTRPQRYSQPFAAGLDTFADETGLHAEPYCETCDAYHEPIPPLASGADDAEFPWLAAADRPSIPNPSYLPRRAFPTFLDLAWGAGYYAASESEGEVDPLARYSPAEAEAFRSGVARWLVERDNRLALEADLEMVAVWAD